MKHPPPLVRPTKEEIAALPLFEGLPLSRIHLLRTAEQLAFAEQELRAAGQVGFDTESKPVFVAGAPQSGPDIVQFATERDAFIVRVQSPGMVEFLRAVIESQQIVKVGFGLKSDSGPLHQRLGLRLGASVDLSFVMRRLGYKDAVGVKTAVAIMLGRRLAKSRRATTSNWASPTLSESQLRYAADDAHAALMVYQSLALQGVLGPASDVRAARPALSGPAQDAWD
jgi:ribonuclease D